MKFRSLVFIAVAGILAASCVSSSKYNELQNNYDTLAAEFEGSESSNNLLTSYLDKISASLEAVAAQENIVHMGVNQDGETMTKEEKLQSLDLLEDIMDKHRKTIETLEKQVKNSNGQIRHLNTIIKNLNEQLAQKEEEIVEMRNELESSRGQVNRLTSRVGSLEQENSTLQQQNVDNQKLISEQNGTLRAQDLKLNEGLVLVGTKKQLVEMGVINRLNSKINTVALDPAACKKVDIREFNTLTEKCKSMKVLTNNPSVSYEIKKNNDGTHTLSVENSADFWKYTQYLIVVIS